MTEPTFAIEIDRTSIASDLDPIALVGTAGRGGWGVLAGWQLPGLQPQTRNADSDWLHGSPAVSFKWIDGVLSGDITYDAEDQGELQVAYAELRQALGRLSYPVVTSWNGVSQLWRARPGSLVPSPLDYAGLRDNQVTYALSIPVHPISTPGGP